MLPAAVRRARLRGADWASIGTVLNLNKDTARHKYGEGCDRPPPAPRAPAPPAPSDERPATGTGSIKPSADHPTSEPPPVPEPTGPPGQLAPVLSKLQRASRLSLRSLGDATRLSSSYLSRIMSGERFPSWDATARLARACGADPAVLRKIWEDARAHRAPTTPSPRPCATCTGAPAPHPVGHGRHQRRHLRPARDRCRPGR